MKEKTALIRAVKNQKSSPKSQFRSLFPSLSQSSLLQFQPLFVIHGKPAFIHFPFLQPVLLLLQKVQRTIPRNQNP